MQWFSVHQWCGCGVTGHVRCLSDASKFERIKGCRWLTRALLTERRCGSIIDLAVNDKRLLPVSNCHSVWQRDNKAGYTAQDTPSTRLKITGDGRTDGPTDGHTLCDGASKNGYHLTSPYYVNLGTCVHLCAYSRLDFSYIFDQSPTGSDCCNPHTDKSIVRPTVQPINKAISPLVCCQTNRPTEKSCLSVGWSASRRS